MAIIYSIYEDDEYIRYDAIIMPIHLSIKDKVLNVQGIKYKPLENSWIPLVEKEYIREIPIKNKNEINIDTYELFGIYRNLQVMVFNFDGNIYSKKFNVSITDYSMNIKFDKEIVGTIVIIRNLSYDTNTKNVYFEFHEKFDKTNFEGASESVIKLENNYIHTDTTKTLIVFKKDLEIKGDIDITQDIYLKRNNSETFNTHGEDRTFYYPVFHDLNDTPINNIYAAKLCGLDKNEFSNVDHKHDNYIATQHNFQLDSHPYLHELINTISMIEKPEIIKDNVFISLKSYKTKNQFIGKHTHTNWTVSSNKECTNKILDFEISEKYFKSKPILYYKDNIGDLFKKVYEGYDQEFDEIGLFFTMSEKYFVIHGKKVEESCPSLIIYSRKSNEIIMEENTLCEFSYETNSNSNSTMDPYIHNHDISISIYDELIAVGKKNTNKIFILDLISKKSNCIDIGRDSIDDALTPFLTKDFLYVGSPSMVHSLFDESDILINAGGLLRFPVSTLLDYNPPSKLIVSCELDNNDMFGFSVSANKSKVVVGAPGVITDGIKSGAVYLFDNDNKKNEIKIVSSLPEENDRFGYKTLLTEELLVVSAPEKNNGTIFIYNTSGGDERVIFSPSESRDFGKMVAITKNNILVGDEYNSIIYVYDIETLKYSVLSSPDLEQNQISTLIGFGLASCDNSLLVSTIIDDEYSEPKVHIHIYEESILKTNNNNSMNKLDLSQYLNDTGNIYLCVSTNSDGFSSPVYSEKIEITPFIVTPILDIDKDYEHVLNNSTIYASEYKTIGMEEPHLKTKWTISTLDGDYLLENIVSRGDKTTINIPADILEELTEYYIEATYYSENYSSTTRIKVKTAMFIPVNFFQEIKLPFFMMGFLGKMANINISNNGNIIIAHSFMAGFSNGDQGTVYGAVAIYRKTTSGYVLDKYIEGDQAKGSMNQYSHPDQYDGVIGYLGDISDDGSHFITATVTKFMIYNYVNDDWVLIQTIERDLGDHSSSDILNINCKISYNGNKLVLIQTQTDRTSNSLLRVFEKTNGVYYEIFSDSHPYAGMVLSISPNADLIATHAQGGENRQIFYIKTGDTYDKVYNNITPLTYSSNIFDNGEFFDGEKTNEIIIMSRDGSNWYEKNRIVFSDLYDEFGENELFNISVSQNKRLIYTTTMVMLDSEYQFRFINSLFTEQDGEWYEISRDFFNFDNFQWAGMVSNISSDGATIAMTAQPTSELDINTFQQIPPKTSLLIFK